MIDFSQNLSLIIILSIMLLSLMVGVIYAARLKASEALWKFALEGSGDGVWDWDIDNNLARLSDRYKQMFGFSDGDINTNIQNWKNCIHPDDATSKDEAMNNYLAGKSEKYVHEHRVICKDNSIKWMLSRGMIVKRNKNGKPLRMVGTHTDITARKLLEDKLKNLAHFDTLTNLPNRALFGDRLKLALAYAKREKKLLAVMFIDLDQFKEINDLYGHEAGDTVLKQVSQRLVSCVRESDSVARMGGDEFVVLLPIIENEVDALLVSDRILKTLARPIKVAQAHLHITSSIGIAIYPQHAKDEKLLVINADRAMYQSKKDGKNQAKIFDEALLKINDLENELGPALH